LSSVAIAVVLSQSAAMARALTTPPGARLYLEDRRARIRA
jgi:hypothetical protein